MQPLIAAVFQTCLNYNKCNLQQVKNLLTDVNYILRFKIKSNSSLKLILELIMEIKKPTEVIRAESLMHKFRAKEDLHRYLSAQVGVFLPTLKGTPIAFLRAILREDKRHLKHNEVVMLEIPRYPEISVKNLYPDALRDPELAKYLPAPDELAGRMPERNFFFGVLATLRRQYVADIIMHAHQHRYKVDESEEKKDGIVISEQWLAELQKHPYISRKAGTAIFLMKENAKARRTSGVRKAFEVKKRLYADAIPPAERQGAASESQKRLNLGGGRSQVVDAEMRPVTNQVGK